MHNLLYKENYRTTEDYELWCRAVHLVKIAKAPGTLLKYRWYKGNATHLYSEDGINNMLLVMQNNLKRLSIDVSIDQVEWLLPETSKTTLRNCRSRKSKLNEIYSKIIEQNRSLSL
jgi:hypothetical protein